MAPHTPVGEWESCAWADTIRVVGRTAEFASGFGVGEGEATATVRS
jgi:hypothetical protein